MNEKRLTLEHALYAAALILALVLRFYHLGAAPLAEVEAGWALQALQVGGGSIADGGATFNTEVDSALPSPTGPQPGYISLTAVLFALLGSTNFLARFWPALAGSLLVLAPLLFRPELEQFTQERFADPRRGRDLGRAAGLVLAFALAIDPGLVAGSRLAGGPMLALSSLVLAAGLWRRRQALLGGLVAGLALLSGPAVIPGLLSLAALAFVYRRQPRQLPPSDVDEAPETQNPDDMRRVWLWALAITIGLLGTLLLRYPQALSGVFETPLAYLRGWVSLTGAPVGQLVAALLVYTPIPLIFGTVWVGREIASPVRHRLTLPLLAWAGAALLLALLYPARQVADLVWVLAPLWALAALEISQHLPMPDSEAAEPHPVSLAQAGLVLVLLALFWYTLTSMTNAGPDPQLRGLRWAVLVGILALTGLTTTLVTLGWSWQIGRQGLVWGLLGGLLVYNLAMLWGAGYVRPNTPQELWTPAPSTGQAQLLTETLRQMSEFTLGDSQRIDGVVVVGLSQFVESTSFGLGSAAGCRTIAWQPASGPSCPRASLSLRWALRDFPNIYFSDQIPAGRQPTVVITPQTQENPALAAAYRGQDFAWWIYPAWTGPLPDDSTRWLVFRDAPLVQEKIILWVRADVFPDDAGQRAGQ